MEHAEHLLELGADVGGDLVGVAHVRDCRHVLHELRIGPTTLAHDVERVSRVVRGAEPILVEDVRLGVVSHKSQKTERRQVST